METSKVSSDKPKTRPLLQPTCVRLCGEYSGECGYCNGRSSVSFGLHSDHMRSEDYEALMMRGFRRCGDFFYKPVMHKTCCPQYAIRLHAGSFRPSKSQRSCLNRFSSQLERGLAFRPKPDTPVPSDELAAGSHSRATPNTLTIETRPSEYTDEIFELYKAYQVAIHGDRPNDLTKESFSDFLVNSSLSLQPEGSVSAAHPLGTHHQLYRIDGRLVAVGVLDFLPSNLSSVYCFYDPSLKHLALGKYTALREIQYCSEVNVPYYCMGFYIHSCPKMNYKGDYSPSELLCPTSVNWFPLLNCKALLDAHKFTPFDPDLVLTREAVGDDLYFKSEKRKRSDGEDIEDIEEGKEDYAAQKLEKYEHVARMANLFGPRREAPALNLDKIALVITGAPREVYLPQLRQVYQEKLRPLLTQWVTYAGNSAAARIRISVG